MNILAGVFPPDSGEIRFEGRRLELREPREARETGIAIIFQELNLILHLSVAQNIFLGREPLTRAGLIDDARMNREAAEWLRRLKLDVAPQTMVAEFRVGQQQVVEIAKAVSLQARVIIMDEPTSAITEQEVAVLHELIRHGLMGAGGTSLNGGRGSVLGTVLGCLIIGVLNNGLVLPEVSPFWQQVIKGLVILAAVAVDRMSGKGERSDRVSLITPTSRKLDRSAPVPGAAMADSPTAPENAACRVVDACCARDGRAWRVVLSRYARQCQTRPKRIVLAKTPELRLHCVRLSWG